MSEGSRVHGWLVYGALLLATSLPASGAVAVLNPFPANPQLTATTGNLSGTFAVSAGTNRLLLVTVQCYDSAGGTGQTFAATYGGQNLTGAFVQNNNRRQTWIGYLKEAGIAGAGSTTLSVAITGAHTGVSAYVASYSGVDQTTPLTAFGGSYINNTNNVAINASALSVNAGGYGLYNWSGTSGVSRSSDNETYSEHADVASGGVQTGVASRAFVAAASTNPTVTWSGNIRASVSFVTLNPAPTAVNPTTAGTVTATASGCSALQVAAPYTGDANSNNTLSYRYRTPSGGTYGAAIPVAHATSPYAFSLSGLTHGAAYDVEVTYIDADGVTGTATQTVSNITVGAACTGAGTVTAAATTGATPSIAVAAPYTFDGNANNTLSYRFRTPSGGTYGAAVPVAHGASPYGFTLSGLSCGAAYDVEVTFVDTDGIGSGTATQTISNILLANCVTAGAPTGVANSCSQVTVSAPYSNNANANGSAAFARGPAAGGPFTAVAGCGAIAGASPRACVDTTVAASTTYYYQVTVTDPDGISGTNPQVTAAIATPACSQPIVTPGLPTATANSCSQITVAAPFTGDTDNDSTTRVEWNTTNTWPGTTPAGCAAITGTSPRGCAVTGLANATAHYFRVTFTDPDGVTGTNPQVIGPASTLECRVTPQVPTATVDSCSRITVSAGFSGDADGDSLTHVARGSAPGGPFGSAICANLSGTSPRSCVDTSVAASATYYYQVDFTDVDGVLGTDPQVIGPFATPACAEIRTTPGSASMVVSGCRQITVAAPFTGDGDDDGAVLVEYSPTNTWPGTSACGAVGGSSPRMCQITGLTPSSVYFVRVTFSDPDGILGGTNPQLLGSVTTTACTGNGAPPMILPLAPSAGAVVGGVERFRVQVYDPDGVATANVLWAIDGGVLANTGVTQSTTYSCNIDSQTACKIFEFDVSTSALANGSHYVTVQATDSAAAPAAVGRRGWGFVVNNVGATAAGSGELLRRTHGSQLCVDCHNLATHSSQSTSFNYGAWAQECLNCHTPHSTKNIYLVREAIETPNSGAKSVDFRNLSGKADFSFATVTAPGSGACEVCHTKTKNSDGTPRFRNSGGSDGGKHYSTSCIACHAHGKGFAAGESEGLATCSGCHADIWNGMNGAVAKASKHSIGNVLGVNDSFTDSNVTWPPAGGGGTLAENAASLRSCLNMCHNDHPHTLTSPLTATHENNAYLDSTSQTSRAATSRTSTDKDKTDFEAAQANGGMCISCHRNPVDATRPAINKAAFDASAHDYTTFSTYGAWTYTQHDGGVFNRNCTKCHAGRNDARPADSAIFFEAVHFSDFPALLAGSTNPNSTPATFVCYNCHGNGTTGVNLSGKAIATQIAKTRNHPSDSDNVHNGVAEFGTAAFGNTLGVTGRHANCLDCHDTHEAKAGVHTTPGNLAGPPLEGAWGAQLSTHPAFWTDTTAASFTKKTIVAGTDLEPTLCLKCHSRFYWGTTADAGRGVPPAAPSGATYVAGTAAFTAGSAVVTGTGTTWTALFVGRVIKNNANGVWYLVTGFTDATHLTIAPVAAASVAASAYTLQFAETDVAKEFNPNNVGNYATTGTTSWQTGETAGSFHPVLAAAGGNLGATGNIVAPWTRTSVMTCSDCHESDTLADPSGPHGSTANFILKGPNTAWSATTTGLANNAWMPAGTFCINCHNNLDTNGRFPEHSRGDHALVCWNCHAAIPHGGPRPGILVAGAGAGANVGGVIAGWDQSGPYWQGGTTNRLYLVSYPANNTTAWSQNNCGCNGTGH